MAQLINDLGGTKRSAIVSVVSYEIHAAVLVRALWFLRLVAKKRR